MLCTEKSISSAVSSCPLIRHLFCCLRALINLRPVIRCNSISVLVPQSLNLGASGEHTVVIRADPLSYNEIGAPNPLRQNSITEFAVPNGYHITVKQEPARHHVLATVTDSIGQGYETPDPSRDAWTAQLADFGLWPGAVMNLVSLVHVWRMYATVQLVAQPLQTALIRTTPTPRPTFRTWHKRFRQL